MTRINRVLDAEPCPSLAEYCLNGGGHALDLARLVEPAMTIDAITSSGLRGRGGAGFPTGTKWSTILANSSAANPTPVVVNGAEGEPSTFKDRAILRANPYRVLEGALIACHVFQSRELVICLKESFDVEIQRVSNALAEMRSVGWLDGVESRIVAGPGHYLFGEETAMLEVVEGRQPFPRVTPPWRRGIGPDDSGATPGELANQQEGSGVPALVNNVETFANVALIVRNGPEWFRQCGTQESPGTIVCTVSGDVMSSGVGEFAMGTPLTEVIESLGIGPLSDRRIVGVLPGASAAIVAEADLGVPLTYESFRGIGSGLGSAGFLCIDDHRDLLKQAYGVARFLSIESCGQCTACKDDGLAVTALLRGRLDGSATHDAMSSIGAIDDHLATITDGARCSLASQHQTVVRSLLAHPAFPTAPLAAVGLELELDSVAADTQHMADEAIDDPLSLAPLSNIEGGVATFDETQQSKQPDWSFESADSQAYPAQLLQDVPI